VKPIIASVTVTRALIGRGIERSLQRLAEELRRR
jgi:hypothetical protein